VSFTEVIDSYLAADVLWVTSLQDGMNLTAKEDTGMRNLPFHDLAQNRVWLAITALATDLLVWTQSLALTGAAASYEPKRLRLRILAVAGCLIRTGRRQLLKIDPG
jgi:Transposase DDE domain group 1